MTLTEKQQEHRRWLEGVCTRYPTQGKAAIRLWDGLVAAVPDLKVPYGWVSDEDFTDAPSGVNFYWDKGKYDTNDKINLHPVVQQSGLVEWFGWNEATYADLPSDGEGGPAPVPPTELPPEAIRLLRTYFTETEQ